MSIYRWLPVLLFLFPVSFLHSQATGIAAPDFSAQTLDGKRVSLHDFHGKVILLDIWASWCGPCKQEIPFLAETDKQYREKGLVILAVNIDKKLENVRKFIDGCQTAPGFRILLDPDAGIPPLYEIKGMPTTLLIDRKGRIRFRHQGFKADATEDLLSEIRTLLGEDQES